MLELEMWKYVERNDVEGLLLALPLYSHIIDTLQLTVKRKTLMYTAAKRGWVSVIEALMRLSCRTIDAPCERDWTPMHIAAYEGRVAVIEALVRLGSKAIDTFDKDYMTPIFAAAKSGSTPVIKTLVRLGAKTIDFPINNGRTPIHEAVTHGHASVVRTLILLGSKAIDTPDCYGDTPMVSAACKGHVSIIELLVQLGSTAINTSNVILLCKTVLYGYKDCVKTLKALGASSPIETPTWWHDKMIKLLHTEISEDESAELRHRVYFRRSLAARLLFTYKQKKINRFNT